MGGEKIKFLQKLLFLPPTPEKFLKIKVPTDIPPLGNEICKTPKDCPLPEGWMLNGVAHGVRQNGMQRPWLHVSSFIGIHKHFVTV